MKRLFALLVLAVVLVGCGGSAADVECYPGTEWSDRAQGCVRVIPDVERER